MFELRQKNKNHLWHENHIFTQIFPKIKRDSFNKLVEKFESNKHSKGNDA